MLLLDLITSWTPPTNREFLILDDLTQIVHDGRTGSVIDDIQYWIWEHLHKREGADEDPGPRPRVRHLNHLNEEDFYQELKKWKEELGDFNSTRGGGRRRCGWRWGWKYKETMHEDWRYDDDCGNDRGRSFKWAMKDYRGGKKCPFWEVFCFIADNGERLSACLDLDGEFNWPLRPRIWDNELIPRYRRFVTVFQEFMKPIIIDHQETEEHKSLKRVRIAPQIMPIPYLNHPRGTAQLAFCFDVQPLTPGVRLRRNKDIRVQVAEILSLLPQSHLHPEVLDEVLEWVEDEDQRKERRAMNHEWANTKGIESFNQRLCAIKRWVPGRPRQGKPSSRTSLDQLLQRRLPDPFRPDQPESPRASRPED